MLLEELPVATGDDEYDVAWVSRELGERFECRFGGNSGGGSFDDGC